MLRDGAEPLTEILGGTVPPWGTSHCAQLQRLNGDPLMTSPKPRGPTSVTRLGKGSLQV